MAQCLGDIIFIYFDVQKEAHILDVLLKVLNQGEINQTVKNSETGAREIVQ